MEHVVAGTRADGTFFFFALPMMDTDDNLLIDACFLVWIRKFTAALLQEGGFVSLLLLFRA